MTDLTHPQELKHTRYLLSEQKMGNTGNDYINRAIETIDQLVAENAELKRCMGGDMDAFNGDCLWCGAPMGGTCQDHRFPKQEAE